MSLCFGIVVFQERVWPSLFKRDKYNARQFFLKYFVGVAAGLLIVNLSILKLPGWQGPDFVRPGYAGFSFAILELLLFTAITAFVNQNKRQIEMQQTIKLSQYAALKAQLNPHFLFNTLNMLSSEIEKAPRNAVQIVDELSDLLRMVFKSSQNTRVPLKEELNLINHYMILQGMRFERRLRYIEKIEQNISHEYVPPMFIQPFLENSLNHAFRSNGSILTVKLDIKKVGNYLIVSITDDGCGFDPHVEITGNGIQLVKDSMAMLYEDNFEFKVMSELNGGTNIVIRIPTAL